MGKRLAALSRHMKKAKGPQKAAELILKVAEKGA
jgi:UDP:flavonoid glycosyltransferase YjiC (YdhE family)